jgi:hypothetical protein
MTGDPSISARTAELLRAARHTLDAIAALAGPHVADPFTDPATLARAVSRGILDAPQLRNNRVARGLVSTRVVDGACVAIDTRGQPLAEQDRLADLMKGAER